ncbi:hypothetical protein TI04_12260, partial [Achromatium sp. WMS2]
MLVHNLARNSCHSVNLAEYHRDTAEILYVFTIIHGGNMRIYLCNQYRVVLLATLMLVIGLGIEHRVAYANSCESGPAR